MLIAWMDDWFSEMPSRKNGWAGSLTIPRRLGVNEEGMLEMFPAEELKKLRKTGFKKSSFIAEKNADVLSGQKAEKFELRFDINLSETSADVIELRVRESFDGKQYTAVIFNLKSKTVTFDKTHSGEVSGSANEIKLKYFNDDSLDTVVYADTTSIEILINKGTTSITNRIYPDPGSTSIHLLSPDGSISFYNLEFYTLGNNAINFMYT
jgi:beta-fructofuranosidase